MRTIQTQFAFGLLLAIPGPAFAQSARYELAGRLQAFEAEWEKVPDAKARQRALEGLPKVTQQFFSFRFGEAGQTLDTARFALLREEAPSDAVLWATSLYPDFKTRLIGGDASELSVTVDAFYKLKVDRPKAASVRLMLGDAKAKSVAIEKLPMKIKMFFPSVKDGKQRIDLTLKMEILEGETVLASRNVGVSRIDGAGEQFPLADKLLADAEALKDAPRTEFASIKDRVQLLKDLATGTILETDIPAAKRLAEAEEILELARDGKKYFTADRPGDHWISISTGDEKNRATTACRLFVPKNLDAKKPVPLVVAMHGAGGSENMFFEGYGAGQIVQLCSKRGWLLVAPRAGLGFGLGGDPPVAGIVKELAERYPVDPKAVLLLGHSMGSAMAVTAVQRDPGLYAALACFGGGGTIRKPEVFAQLPVFIAVGDKDFALNTARKLNGDLLKSNAKKVTLKEYTDLEHLTIVREALGDAFDRFDKLVAR